MVLTITWVPSKLHHTGEVCGAPSRIIVVSAATGGPWTSRACDSGMAALPHGCRGGATPRPPDGADASRVPCEKAFIVLWSTVASANTATIRASAYRGLERKIDVRAVTKKSLHTP